MNGVAVGFDEHYWLQRPIPSDYANWTDRIYPYGSTRGGSFRTHHGVEFFNPVGVPVVATGGGVVVTAGTDDQIQFGPQASFYGNLVVIRHDQLYREQYLYTLYGHLSQVLVSEGQLVTGGDMIGLVGGTGVANGGAHLHFEVRIGANSYDVTRNPELWLQPFPGWGTIAGRVTWPDGTFVYEAPLLIQRVDDPALFVRRTVYTYADDTVNPDDQLRENFTSPDVEPGPYEVILKNGTSTQRGLVWVYSGRTSFVELQAIGEPTAQP
jgi:murein DD-endopeptidase MepM/ murein hydrolase activator NlpD